MCLTNINSYSNNEGAEQTNDTSADGPRIVKDKKDAQVGDMYEVKPTQGDPEQEYMIDAARKRYEVRKMLD